MTFYLHERQKPPKVSRHEQLIAILHFLIPITFNIKSFNVPKLQLYIF